MHSDWHKYRLFGPIYQIEKSKFPIANAYIILFQAFNKGIHCLMSKMKQHQIIQKVIRLMHKSCCFLLILNAIDGHQLYAKLPHHLNHWYRLAAEICDAVLYSWRNLIVLLSQDEPVSLKLFELTAQHLGADMRQCPLEL